ncbi:hypothetical protein QZH41_020442, partial [Actinostola sp. cb2023]
WGMVSYPGHPSTVLQQAAMPVVPSTLCQSLVFNNTHVITPGMICAGDKGKTKTSGCFGDSGGPFVCRLVRDIRWPVGTAGCSELGVSHHVPLVDISLCLLESACIGIGLTRSSTIEFNKTKP